MRAPYHSPITGLPSSLEDEYPAVFSTRLFLLVLSVWASWQFQVFLVNYRETRNKARRTMAVSQKLLMLLVAPLLLTICIAQEDDGSETRICPPPVTCERCPYMPKCLGISARGRMVYKYADSRWPDRQRNNWCCNDNLGCKWYQFTVASIFYCLNLLADLCNSQQCTTEIVQYALIQICLFCLNKVKYIQVIRFSYFQLLLKYSSNLNHIQRVS